MKRLALICLLALLGVGACNALKRAGDGEDKSSRVVKEFNPSWLFAGESSALPAASGKKSLRSYSGVMKDAAGKMSVEKLATSVSSIAASKIVELGGRVCGTVTPSVNKNSKTVIITYQTDTMAGTMTIAMQASPDAAAVTWILVIDEDVRPAKAPGGG